MNSDVSEMHSCANTQRNKSQMEPHRGNPEIIHFLPPNHILGPKCIFGLKLHFCSLFTPKSHVGPKKHIWAQIALLGPKCFFGPKLHFWAQNACCREGALCLQLNLQRHRELGRVRNAFLRQPPPKQASDGATSGKSRIYSLFTPKSHFGPKSIVGPNYTFGPKIAFWAKIALLGPKCMLGTRLLPGHKGAR